MRRTIIILLAISTIAYGYGSYFGRGDYDIRTGDILLSYDEAETVWFNLDTPLYKDATDINSVSIRASESLEETYYMRWPVNSGDANSVLMTPGEINSQLWWAVIDANLMDGNDIALPTLTPGSIIFVDANGFPLYEDNANLYYDDANNFVGINTNSPRDRLEVAKRFVTDPVLYNTLVGHEAGNSITIGQRNTLGGYQAGYYIVNTNDNTAWGYQAVGGGGSGAAASYPLLRTTTAQADPGLAHTTPISSFQDLYDNLQPTIVNIIEYHETGVWKDYLRVHCDAPHGLSANDWVWINGSIQYDGNYTVYSPTATEFTVSKQFVTDDACGIAYIDMWHESAVEKHLYLTQNINASETSDPNFLDGGGWVPVNAFNGTFDGCGYSISNLYLNRPYHGGYNGPGMGLLGRCRYGFTIANLTLSNIDFRHSHGGGLASWLDGQGLVQSYKFYNCHVTGNIRAIGDNLCYWGGFGAGIGGLIGTLGGVSAYPAYIYDCTADVDIDANADHGYHTDNSFSWIGGLWGFCPAPAFAAYGYVQLIQNCSASGDIDAKAAAGGSGATQIGGFGGAASYFYGNPYATISDCYATGNVSGDRYVGGFFGDSTAYLLTRCYATGDVHCYRGAEDNYAYVGGFSGSTGGSGTILDCYATGNVTGGKYSGGFVGVNSKALVNCYSTGSVSDGVNEKGFAGAHITGGTYTSCYWDMETSGQATTAGSAQGKTTTEMKQKTTFADWDFDTIWYMEGGNVLAATGVGSYALSKIETGGDYTVGLGYKAGAQATTPMRSIYIGPYSGYNQTTLDDRFILDNRDRTSAADEMTDSLFYGYIAADPNDSWLNINADVNVAGDLTVTGNSDFNDVNITGTLTVSDFADINDSNIAGDLVLENLTASRLLATDSDKVVESTDANDWIDGTTNQVIVTDDTDGTVTLSTPQDIHTGASPTFVKTTLTGDEINIATSQTPASPAAPGTQGDIAWDSGYVYVCVANNTWKRTALTSWGLPQEHIIYAGENVVYAAEQVVYP